MPNGYKAQYNQQSANMKAVSILNWQNTCKWINQSA